MKHTADSSIEIVRKVRRFGVREYRTESSDGKCAIGLLSGNAWELYVGATWGEAVAAFLHAHDGIPDREYTV